MSTVRIKHFGVWLKNVPTLRISRENYAVIDKRNSLWRQNRVEWYKKVYKDPEARKEIYDDEECRFHSDVWCERWRQQCLENFDYNMTFFERLDKQAFEEALQLMLSKNKKIKEVSDLKDYEGVSGLYIMVLDTYKQVYIGQARNIKRRILQHWSRKKEFDRLLWGGVDNSVLSIDNFGALDTTRLFVLTEADSVRLNRREAKAVKEMPDIFKLNRVGGGGISDAFSVISTMNLRKYET